MRKTTIKQMMKEVEELEPKSIVDYIFKGSGLSQWMKINKINVGLLKKYK